MNILDRFMPLTTFASRRKDEVLLLIRVTIAPIFIQSGLGKFTYFKDTVGFFASLGIPFPALNAVLATSAEFIGGVLLLFGLFTRLVSLPLAFVMVVAIATAKWATISGYSDFIRLQEWDYLVVFLLFAAVGAGKWSLDHLFCGKKR